MGAIRERFAEIYVTSFDVRARAEFRRDRKKGDDPETREGCRLSWWDRPFPRIETGGSRPRGTHAVFSSSLS